MRAYRLPHAGTPRVGLVWSVKPSHKNDHNCSITLKRFAPLLAAPSVSFVSLQREIREADLATLDALPQMQRLDQV